MSSYINVFSRDKEKWAAAKKAVRDSTKKREAYFSDADWAQVEMIYQNSNNPAHRFKRIRKALSNKHGK